MLKGTEKEKLKGVYAETCEFQVSNDTYKTDLMFLSREIDIKLCQIYTEIHIYAILYKSCRFKQINFRKYETNLKRLYPTET